jgi:hypothetical protein
MLEEIRQALEKEFFMLTTPVEVAEYYAEVAFQIRDMMRERMKDFETPSEDEE